MPEPAARGQRYLPGLDGLRALAVLAVMAYHVGLSWAPGGLIGVGVFFTLSGYLITDLLLGQWRATGGLRLRDFWLRRARRLLPALFVLLAVVLAWVTLADPQRLGALRGAVAAAAAYVSNWWLIAAHHSYFARFAPPSPLGHLWSLAVEEQFYLIWPWLLLLGLWCTRRGPRGWRLPGRPRAAAAAPAPAGPSGSPSRHAVLAGGTLVLAAASAVEMALLYRPGFDPTRVYDGTDTRAFALLAGAALAMLWPSMREWRTLTARSRRLADAAGVAGLAVVGVLIWRTSQYSPFLYRGGLVLAAGATVAVVAAVVVPGSALGRVLGWRPLRWVGVRSYGIYLWHYPVIVLAGPAGGGDSMAPAVAQVAVSVVLAALSWRFVEEPIRRGALGRWWAAARSAGWAPRVVTPRAWVAAGATVAVLALAGTGLAEGGASRGPGAALRLSMGGSGRTDGAHAAGTSPGAGAGASPRAGKGTSPRAGKGPSTAKGRPRDPARAKAPGLVSVLLPPRALGLAPAWGLSPVAAAPVAAAVGPAGAATAHGATGAPRTSCRSVVHIGDSTSEGMVSSDYLPDPAQRLPAQYERVGVQSWHMEITGGTSIVETINGTPNAYQVARRLVRSGYRGCWVLALGTNDTADVAVGSPVSLATRIERMMSVIGHQPVLWVNVKSLVAGGPYSEANMLLWDRALMRACPRYPAMRVFDWAAVVKDRWFISDGIHYTSAGYAARGRLIANALAMAFPQSGGESPGCVIP